jgi:HSP20 family protein
MTKVLQLQPWMKCRAVQDFHRSIDDIFKRSLGGSGWRVRTAIVQPSIELTLEGDEYLIRLDLPGVDPKSIEVTVNEDIVTVRGCHQHRDPRASWDVIYCELARGGFERRVRLPAGIHSEDIRAIYDHGTLELRMPSPQKKQARKVLIQVEAVKGRDRRGS